MDLRNKSVWASTLPILLTTLLVGCSNSLPAVKPPSIDVASAVEAAIAEFDKDNNGVLAKNEACMGITNQWERYDEDGDGAISSAELGNRFRKWTDGDTGMMNLRVQLNFRGQPLPDADITMTPFAFLGDNVLQSVGKTDSYGYAFMAVPKENLPESQQTNYGMQVGLFQVSITHAEKKLAAKYNEESELSVDLSPNEANTGVIFNLK